MLVYGATVEAERISVERRTLRLPRWPEHLRGFRIALLSDFLLRGRYSLSICRQAIVSALAESPDMVVIAGDFVSYWSLESPKLLGELLEPLLLMNGSVVAVPGNHDYSLGSPEILGLILDELNIKLLRNESWDHLGVTWVGIDSAIARRADPCAAMEGVESPAVVVWHEPDLVDLLPRVPSLMVSGHSHGGQFRFPGGFTPMHTKLGKKYPRGFYPDTRIPLYTSRGIGTTGPPSRFNCPPEVAILTLIPRTCEDCPKHFGPGVVK